MTPEDDELFSQIEAEQSLILKLIDENKRICAHSSELIDAARRGKTAQSEEETQV